MKVFKFGGASINTLERIKNIASILRRYPDEKIMIVISAMGKTTNALEKVVDAFFSGNRDEALGLFDVVKKQHLDVVKYLLVTEALACERQLLDFFTEVEWLLQDKPVREYDYYYDQIVCAGELLSSTIVAASLREEGLANTWLDVRDILRTDGVFRDAAVDLETTQRQLTDHALPAFARHRLVITQGFIGATDENESTTLGREGSDYSAALFANLLDADSLVIWKDVTSVMNADPRQFPNALPIARLSFEEVIEMAYYGAQVIHPKTIKPLQNKSIPLLVKCFLDPDLPGTVIDDSPVHDLPAIMVLKEKQVLLKMNARDFSFVGETHVSHLYRLLGALHIRPNLTQNAAISFIAVTDELGERTEKLAMEAAEFFDVEVRRGLSLLTLRHYTEPLIAEMTKGKKILLRQQTERTVQLLFEA